MLYFSTFTNNKLTNNCP